jgi:L-threonylcarbamoyladenylate synthase
MTRLGAVLRRGGLVALPTETVYGLAANALDARACRKIFRAKGRPAGDPLIVHVRGLRDARRVAVFNPVARRLAARFWPGPLTLVLPKKPVVPAVVTAGLDSVAVRAPSHHLFRRMLRLAGVPLAAPSANPFGGVSPTSAAHVHEGLGGRIDHILDGGPCPVGVESTIVDVRDPSRPRLLRPGVISAAALSRVAGVRVRAAPRRSAHARVQLAPGMRWRHYSPQAELRLVRRIGRSTSGQTAPATALLHWRKPAAGADRPDVFWLSASGSAREAARRLYAVLRGIDARGFRHIVAERLPAGLPAAEAVNDRLSRAAHA